MSIDPTSATNANDDFVGGNDKTPKFERDERFIRCIADAKPDSWDFGPGDNYFFVLPSSSDYQSFFPERRADYQIGKPYHRITVRKAGDKSPRNFRTGRENPLSKAYWRLYESLSSNKPLWKEVTDGFNAGGDWRRCLNIVVMKPGPKISPLKMLSAPDERASKAPGQQPALYTMVRDALLKAFNRLKASHPGAMPFFPQTAVLLKLTLSFRGTIPQYNLVDVYDNDGQIFVQDLTEIIGDPKCLDGNAQWCSESDELPDLSEIHSILKSPQSCEILGLTGSGAQPSMGSAPLPGFQPPAFQPQQSAPVVPQAPAFQPRQSAPAGFGVPVAPVVPQAPAFQPQQSAAAPVVAAPVNPVPNAAAASAAFASSLAAEIERKKATGAPF